MDKDSVIIPKKGKKMLTVIKSAGNSIIEYFLQKNTFDNQLFAIYTMNGINFYKSENRCAFYPYPL